VFYVIVIPLLITLANIRMVVGANVPGQLVEQGAALGAGFATSVVPTFTPELAVHNVRGAPFRVAIANALAPNADVRKGVEIATSDGMVEFLVPLVDHHQIGIECLQAEQPHSDKARFCEFLQ
jgi:hypothetical protein